MTLSLFSPSRPPFHSDCVCDDCHNDGNHEAKRIDAIRRIRMNNSNAFKGTGLEIEDQEVRTPRGSLKVIRGCRCKRSKCKKKYCECFGAGLACSTNCVCSDCQNGNDAGSINVVSDIMMKPSKAPAQLRAGKPGSADSETDEEAAYQAEQTAQRQAQRPKTKARGSSSVSTLPSQNTQKHLPARNQPQQQASQRPPHAQESRLPGSEILGGGPSGGGKKSFRRNDLKVGVPVPTYVPPPTLGEADSARMAIVTPHGSIHLPNTTGNTRSSPRLSLLGTLGMAAPLPGAGFRREESSPRLQWGPLQSASRRSASPRWPQGSPAMMREDLQWDTGDAGSGFGLLRNDSLMQEQYSPLSGELKSPTTRSRRDVTLNSARESERDSLQSGLLPGGGAMAAMGGGGALQRRSSSRSGGGLLSAGPFGRSGNTPPVSPLVTDGVWGGLLSDPTQEPSFF